MLVKSVVPTPPTHRTKGSTVKKIFKKMKAKLWDTKATFDPDIPMIGLYTPPLRRAWDRWGIATFRWLGLLIAGALILKLSGLS